MTNKLSKFKLDNTEYLFEDLESRELIESLYSNMIKDTASGNPAIFNDGANLPVKSLTAQINPKQDLNGFNYPWVGGAGKNKLPNNWFSTSMNGITFTVSDDGTVTANGTATANATFYYDTEMAISQNMILNGCPIDGSVSKYVIIARTTTSNYLTDDGSGVTIESGSVINRFAIIINSGQTVNNLEFKPMLRLASETDASYAPYENICPITGYDEVNVTRTGKNLIDLAGTFASSQDSSVTLPAGDYYVYIFNSFDTSAYNSFIQYFNGTSYVNFSTTPNEYGYVDATMQYNRKKCKVTLNKTCTVRQRLQINSATSGAIFAAMLTKDGSNYASVPNAVPYSMLSELYEPYQSQTVTVTLNDTTYGGTLNVTTGELTVDKEYHAVSEFTNWVYSADNNFFYQAITGKKAGVVNIICDEYQTKARGTWTSSDDCVVSGNSNTAQVYIRDSRYTNVSDFRANATASICYELAEPQTIQLTASQLSTILGTNVISADSGAVTVEYYADMKLYIDSKLN